MRVFFSSQAAVEIINCGMLGTTKEPNETPSGVVHSTGSSKNVGRTVHESLLVLAL